MQHRARPIVTSLLTMIAALALSIGGPAEAVSPVTNPGFENSLATGWTLQYVFGGPSEFLIADRTTASEHSGAYGAHFRNMHDGTMEAYFKQVVLGLVPGATYQLGAWYRRTWKRPDVYDVYVEAIGGGPARRTPTAPEDCSWVWYTVNQTATPSGTVEVRLRYDKFKNTVDYKIAEGYFDDVSLALIPEPSSLLGLLSAVSIVGYAIRRRR